MTKLTQISMRRLERLDPGCTGSRAWFVNYRFSPLLFPPTQKRINKVSQLKVALRISAD